MKKLQCLIQISALLLAVTQLHAQGILNVSNLGQPSYNGGPFNYGEIVNSMHPLAGGFITGTNSSGYTLGSIQVLMGDTELGPGSFNVSIFADNDGQLGTNLGSLSGSPSPYIAGTYTYTSSGIVLSPSSAYWIVLTSDSSYLWEDTLSTHYDSSEGWSIIQSPSGQQLQFGVSASSLFAAPVPEPETLALLVLGAMAFFLRRKK